MNLWTPFLSSINQNNHNFICINLKMRKLSLLFFLLFASLLYAQDFLNGYYITNNGQRVEGKFLETNFLDASDIKFKGSSDNDYKTLDTENITEFGIEDKYKSVKHTVQIDISDASQGQVSANKDATWQKQTLFLNVILEGDATFYSYTTSKNTKYFYKVKDRKMEPEQLLYRKYTSGSNSTSENNKYRQQLYNEMNCNDANTESFLNLKYNRGDLLNYFKEYNACKKSEIKIYRNKTDNYKWGYYSVFAGFYHSTFNLSGINPAQDNVNDITFSAGAELLIFMKSEKLGLFLRTEYEKIDSEISTYRQSPYSGVITENIYEINGTLINFYIGPRYYFELNHNNKLLIDGSAVFTVSSGDLTILPVAQASGEFIEGNPINISLTSAVSGNFGIGYTYKNKYSIEARYTFNRNLINDSGMPFKAQSGVAGINLRYTIN